MNKLSSNDELSIRMANWSSEEAIVKNIRDKVFVKEQGVDKNIEWDGEDYKCFHILAEQKGSAIGTARLMPSGKIGRVAVLQEYRNQGIGGKIIEFTINLAKQMAYEKIYLYAQVQTTDFYRKYGFEPFDNQKYFMKQVLLIFTFT